MPRGLGDDPLSRQRKNAAAKRSVASAATSHVNDSAAPSSTAQLSVQNIADVPSSSPASTASSYNDVFWKKRAEAAQVVSTAVATHEVVTSEPAPAPFAAAPVESPLLQETHEAAIPEAPVPAIAPAPDNPAPVAAQSPPPVEAQPEPQKEKGGFFSRFFGKLRK